MVRSLKMTVLLLSIHPLHGQCLIHLHPTHLHFLFLAPVTRWWLFLSKGQWRQCPSTVFLANWWANVIFIPSITGNLPVPLGVKPAHHPPHLVGCCSGILLQTCKIPYPLNHWWLCHQIWFLSLVLKLGKHRAFGLTSAAQQHSIAIYHKQWYTLTFYVINISMCLCICIYTHYQIVMSKAWPLYTSAKFNLGERVLGEVEKDSFIFLPGIGGSHWSQPWKL